jgi:hypothetical protein
MVQCQVVEVKLNFMERIMVNDVDISYDIPCSVCGMGLNVFQSDLTEMKYTIEEAATKILCEECAGEAGYDTRELSDYFEDEETADGIYIGDGEYVSMEVARKLGL